MLQPVQDLQTSATQVVAPFTQSHSHPHTVPLTLSLTQSHLASHPLPPMPMHTTDHCGQTAPCHAVAIPKKREKREKRNAGQAGAQETLPVRPTVQLRPPHDPQLRLTPSLSPHRRHDPGALHSPAHVVPALRVDIPLLAPVLPSRSLSRNAFTGMPPNSCMDRFRSKVQGSSGPEFVLF
jgi:hypothetical protein